MKIIIAELISLADDLDACSLNAIANKVDDIIIKLSSNYPDWNATQNRSKQYQLFEQYRSGNLTKEQYQLELKKIEEERKKQMSLDLEQKTYQNIKDMKQQEVSSKTPPQK